MEQLYIITGKSESGDDYGPWAFKHEPTDEELKKLITWCDGSTEEDWTMEYLGTTFDSWITFHVDKEDLYETLSEFLDK
jgi:hypothetical protein